MLKIVTPYLELLRIDHWIKNIFILPGIIIALVVNSQSLIINFSIFILIIFGVLLVCLASSANYIINEWLDRETDIYNSEKEKRSSIRNRLKPKIIYLLYLLISFTVSVLSLYIINLSFFITIQIFLLIGLIYNVKPLRLKDIAFLDVIVESSNNPIRLYLGWVIVAPEQIPPFSLLLAFWLGGCFLMNSKRLQEYICALKENTLNKLIKYRISFKSYSYNKLLFANIFYAITSYGLLTIFLAKWRIEYIFILPFIAILFSYYFVMCINLNSVVRNPEKLYKNWKFHILLLIIGVSFLVLSFYDVEFIQYFFNDTVLYQLSN
jgi:4-hydroxybenzoate polyprenyltransferase